MDYKQYFSRSFLFFSL